MHLSYCYIIHKFFQNHFYRLLILKWIRMIGLKSNFFTMKKQTKLSRGWTHTLNDQFCSRIYSCVLKFNYNRVNHTRSDNTKQCYVRAGATCIKSGCTGNYIFTLNNKPISKKTKQGKIIREPALFHVRCAKLRDNS